MKNKMVLSHEMSTAFEWDSWRDKIPALKFPAHWEIKIIPPDVGAIIRFLVRGKNEWISVYLDGYNLLGYFGEPYWEIYPDVNDDNFRCPMPDTHALIAAIEAALKRET